MTVRTTLSFTDRHHHFLAEKVGQGVYASTSAAVAAAVEQMIEDETAREAALGAMTDEIRRRMAETDVEHVGIDAAIAAAAGEIGRG